MGTVLILIVYRDCSIKTRAGQKSYIGGLNSENARAEKRLCISHGKSGRWVVYSG